MPVFVVFVNLGQMQAPHTSFEGIFFALAHETITVSLSSLLRWFWTVCEDSVKMGEIAPFCFTSTFSEFKLGEVLRKQLGNVINVWCHHINIVVPHVDGRKIPAIGGWQSWNERNGSCHLKNNHKRNLLWSYRVENAVESSLLSNIGKVKTR